MKFSTLDFFTFLVLAAKKVLNLKTSRISDNKLLYVLFFTLSCVLTWFTNLSLRFLSSRRRKVDTAQISSTAESIFMRLPAWYKKLVLWTTSLLLIDDCTGGKGFVCLTCFISFGLLDIFCGRGHKPAFISLHSMFG